MSVSYVERETAMIKVDVLKRDDGLATLAINGHEIGPTCMGSEAVTISQWLGRLTERDLSRLAAIYVNASRKTAAAKTKK